MPALPLPAPPPAPVPLDLWLRLPRPEAEPGIWRCGYRPRRPDTPRTPAPQLIAGALASALGGYVLFALLWNGYLGAYWLWPLDVLTPDPGRASLGRFITVYAYYGLVAALIAWPAARIGRWAELWRRAWEAPRQAREAASYGAPPTWSSDESPAPWPALRRAGATGAADQLAAELSSGRMSDVDHARITHVWQTRVQARPSGTTAFTWEVTAWGAAAYPHHSGARDLPARTTAHDLSLRQVRIGDAVDSVRNPHAYRAAGIALDPDVLGTSVLAVGTSGPSGAGRTGRSSGLVRPVVESLCLQALAGQAAVLHVSSDAPAGLPDEAYDMVVRPGSPASAYSLDLYGTAAPDAAAAMLAEALTGDLTAAPAGDDSSRSATTLAEIIEPFHRVHGRLPGIPELRALLESDDTLRELRSALAARPDRSAYDDACLRALDALPRQSTRPWDSRALLADRVALLDRPALADAFTPCGTLSHGTRPCGTPPSPPRPPFSPHQLDRPMRVRVDLPEQGHADASRILARLLLAQFTEWARARGDQDLFVFLVLDDAARTVTAGSLRGLQRLRSAHGGALLALRALADGAPEHLHAPLLGTVGCRIACGGLSPWDAGHFAGAWAAEQAGASGAQPWSAAELTSAVRAGHAVLSLTTVRGVRTPPLLATLAG